MFIIIIKINIPADAKAEQSVNFIKAGDRYYLLSDGGAINAFKTKEEAQNCFGYGEYHKRNITWSTSATIHWLQYQPVIYKLESEDVTELTEKFFKGQEKFHTCRLSSMAGGVGGVEIEDPTLAKQRYEEGERVELI